MDNVQDELMRDLQSPPLVRHGFTEGLRGRIERAIDEIEKREQRRPVWLRAVGIWGSAAAVMMIAVVFIYKLTMLDGPPLVLDQAAPQMMSASYIAEERMEAAPLRSGVLVGLRDKDHGYRTLWIAPDGSQFAVREEGEGLLVPYRLDFWKVDVTDAGTGKEKGRMLTARKVSIDKKDKGIQKDSKQVMIGDIEFVGQQYVALRNEEISDSDRDGNGNDDGFRSGYMVTMLSELSKGKLTSLPLGSLVEGNVDETAVDMTDWTIARSGRKWQVVSKDDSVTGHLQLNKSILAYDGACSNWEEIAGQDPAALDAVCSPTRDAVVVFTPREIHVYPYNNNRLARERALVIPLKKEEQLVMAEWATDDYVNKWNDWLTVMLR